MDGNRRSRSVRLILNNTVFKVQRKLAGAVEDGSAYIDIFRNGNAVACGKIKSDVFVIGEESLRVPVDTRLEPSVILADIPSFCSVPQQRTVGDDFELPAFVAEIVNIAFKHQVNIASVDLHGIKNEGGAIAYGIKIVSEQT